MFTNLTGQSFLIIIAGVIALYYAVMAICYRKSVFASLLNGKGQAGSIAQATAPGFPHELIARPLEMEGQPVEILLERDLEDESTLEMLDDDDSILVKEAEKAIEQVQVEIDHIASHPPNPQEVFTKVRAIVRQYRIFENTEYFEPINRFIGLTVERDCKIQWSEQELISLWK